MLDRSDDADVTCAKFRAGTDLIDVHPLNIPVTFVAFAVLKVGMSCNAAHSPSILLKFVPAPVLSDGRFCSALHP